MKKTLLVLLGSVLTALASHAGEYVYSMCGDGEIQGLGVREAGVTYSAAIEVPENVAQSMIGSKVTGVSLGFAQGTNKVTYLYLTYDLNEAPFYEEEVRVKVNQFNDYTYQTPYTIEGKKFYIGYRYRANTSSGNPIGFDGDEAGGSSLFAHFGARYDDTEMEWMTAEHYGNLCLKAIIEGENLPKNAVIPAGISADKNADVNATSEFTLRFRNLSTEPVNKISVKVTAQGVEKTRDITLPAAVPADGYGEVRLSAVFTAEELDAKLSAQILSVNGSENLFATESSNATLIVSNYVYPRVIVSEKHSGTTCGWCPRGIVAFDRMYEAHPETFIGISIQNYSSADPMYCGAYAEFDNRNLSGAPSALVSRNREIGCTNATPDQLASAYNKLEGVVNVRLKIYAEMEEGSTTQLNTTTTAEFGTPEEEAGYGIAVVVTEDGLGPYKQSNSYAGGSSGSMDGWENRESRYSMIYNHIARTVVDVYGATESIPAVIEQGVRYEHLRDVTLKPEWVKENLTVIALLINTKTGEIVTAAKCPVGTPYSSIGEVVGDKSQIAVEVLEGTIKVSGSESAAIWSIDGQLVASQPGGEISVAPGIYVVRATAAGKTVTRKVAVR
ncbi:MAG: Omp28-related outer membrane protein [Clostridium sp.]|nr:Omp28-related outer membrane protein [Clostridium sp.]